MRLYETAFLIAPNLPEEDTAKLVKDMSGIVSKKKGKMKNVEEWGKRKLAYPINKFEEAFYVFLHYEGDPDIPLELERKFKQTEAVLRFLTVKKDLKENIRKKKKPGTKRARKVEPRKKEPKEETQTAEIKSPPEKTEPKEEE
jgi:small subunit ribosomal protein S6